MKVVEKVARDVELINVGETKAFTFAANGEIIKNVITSIYSAREKTVVRELIANAIDAHAACGKDEAIDVFLPTAFDPVFAVRDYGIGMTHEFVMTLYSAIGYSTKSQSNDQTGMFGVGSKSPLSISDTFTVRCFDKPGWNGAPYIVGDHDLNETGRVRLYTIAILDSEVPQISHTFDVLPRPEDKIEQGGTEVKVPVSAHDRSRILDGLVTQQFCWFDKKINFGGAQEEVASRFYKSIIKIADDMYVGEKPRTTAIDYSSDWNVFARQGAATYKVDESIMGGKIQKSTLMALRALSRQDRHLMIDLPIGTVDVTMAREGIRYNETSTTNLAAAIEKSIATFEEKLGVFVGDAHTTKEALKRLAANFIEAPEDRTSFKALKLTSSLLPLVMPRVRDNYEEYYATLSPVPRVTTVYVTDENGVQTSEPMKDSDGNIMTTVVMVPAPKHPPFVEVRVEATKFAAGPVRMHKAYISAGWGAAAQAQVCGVERVESFEFSQPCAVYIVPSFMQNWRESVEKHVAQHYVSANFPENTKEGMPVCVIRCAKKYIDAAKSEVISRGLAWDVFEEADLPVLVTTAKVRSARNTSKSAAYAYDISRNEWGKDRVEPNYDEPAFYLVRKGTTGDMCYGYMTKPSTKAPARGDMGEYNVGCIIRYATQLGLIPADTPVYRLTEKQADRLSKNKDNEWAYLTESLFEEAERLYASHAEYNSLAVSDLYTDRHGGGAGMANWADSAMSGDNPHVFDIIDTLAKTDALFRLVVGVRHVMGHDRIYKVYPTETITIVQSLRSALFLNDYSGPEYKDEYESLVEVFNERYKALSHICTRLYDGSMAQPIAEFAQLFAKKLEGQPFTQQDSLPVNSLVSTYLAFFDKKLDEAREKLYGPTHNEALVA